MSLYSVISLPGLALIVGPVDDAGALDRLLVAQDAGVEDLEDVAVDDLGAALGLGRVGLGGFALDERVDLVVAPMRSFFLA